MLLKSLLLLVCRLGKFFFCVFGGRVRASVWLYQRHIICVLWIVHIQNTEKLLQYTLQCAYKTEIMDFSNAFYFHVYLVGTFTRPIQKYISLFIGNQKLANEATIRKFGIPIE